MWKKLGCVGVCGAVILAGLTGCSGTVSGAVTAILRGVVLDQGRPVGRALVYVEGYRGTTSLSDFTDDQGEFTLSGIPTGNYVIIAEATIGARFLRGETPLLRVVSGEDRAIGPINLQLVEGGRFKGAISGYVLDTDGQTVVGATVLIDGESITTVTGFQGGFLLREVTPDRTYSLVAAVTAQDGRRWEGRRDGVRVAEGETTTNANLMVAPQGQMGTILGQVTDAQGQPVEGATVTAGLVHEEGYLATVYLTATTDRRGDYVLADVPVLPNGIELTASAVDRENAAAFVGNLTPGGSERRDFVLVDTVSTAPSAPQNLDIQALTYPRDPERIGNPSRLYEPIRRIDYEEAGSTEARRWLRALPALTAQAERRSATRRPPTGMLIEIDVQWDPVLDSDLAGYRLYRSLFALKDFVPIADLVGPDSWLGADLSDDLSVETRYYYSVTSYSLRRNAESRLSADVSVVPLPPLELKGPPSGPFATSDTPLFEWEAVRGATQYKVFIFHDFPSLSYLATRVRWGDGDNKRIVRPPATSVRYDGNGLVSGEDYFWVVIADNCPSNQGDCEYPPAKSCSPIWNFTVE